MELMMSMFATPADYWKARAELAERTVVETAKELDCEPDNEAMLKQASELKNRRFPRGDGGDGWTIKSGLLRRIADRTAEMDRDYRAHMETVELVMLAIEQDGATAPNA